MTSTIVRNNTKSKSALFLLELIIAIMFFALSSVICIQLFVKAHTISQGTSDLNMAVIQAESVAEVFKSSGGDGEKLKSILNPYEDSDNRYRLLYGPDWQRTGDEQTAKYFIYVDVTVEGALKAAEISVYGASPKDNADSDNDHIYKLTAKTYMGREALQ